MLRCGITQPDLSFGVEAFHDQADKLGTVICNQYLGKTLSTNDIFSNEFDHILVFDKSIHSTLTRLLK